MADSPTTLEGRLHPASILIRAMAMIRAVALMIVVSTVQLARGGMPALWPLAWLGFVTFLVAVPPVIHWLRYRWRVTAEALEVESGLLGKQVRRIPLSRIQDVDTSQGIVHRMFGVVALSVHTASTQKAEVEFTAVSRGDAERLIAALRGTVTAAPESVAPPPMLSVSTGQLVLRGLTDNRAGLVLASGLAVLERLGDGDRSLFAMAYDWAAREAEVVSTASPLVLVALGLSSVLALMLVGYAASVGFNVLTFHGFTLRLDGEVFRREHGLFTRRVQALPRARLQALVLHQSPMRRLARIASLEAHDMGSSTDAQSARQTGRDGFVPVASPEALRAVMQVAFPGLDERALPLRPVSPRLIRRALTLGLVASAATLALAAQTGLWWLGGLAALWPVLAGGWGALAHRGLRVALDGPFVAIRRGVLWREEVLVPTQRIEAVTLSRSPLDRWHGVATVRVIVGGGARFSVHDVPLEPAREALDRLSMLADAEAISARGS